jgi:hypothetical protein
MSDWLSEYYADVDHMRLDDWLARHTDNVVVKFGNNPPAQGKAEVGANIGGFWSTIEGLHHTVVNRWDVDGTTICELAVDYTRKDGSEVTLPCTSILHREGDLVDELRVYIDLAPLFA